MEVPQKQMAFMGRLDSYGFLGYPVGGVQSHGGTTNSWMVFVNGKILLGMDENWGYLHLWKPPVSILHKNQFCYLALSRLGLSADTQR